MSLLLRPPGGAAIDVIENADVYEECEDAGHLQAV